MFLVSQQSFGMQQTVRLLGDLGERYGAEHTYHNLRSPAEAIKLLCINKPEFQKELTEAHKHGIGYTLVQAGESLDYDDLHLPLGKNDLLLTPVVVGSGGGNVFTSILIGVGLVALSFVSFGAGSLFAGSLGVTGAFAGAGAATAWGSVALLGIGGALILQGAAQLLSPQPVIPSLGKNRTTPGENTNASGTQGVSRATSGQQSYAFTGPANTVGIGATVPLVYGKLLIGSHLISSKVEVADESEPASKYFSIPGPASILVNGEKPTNKFKSLNGLRTRIWSDDQVRIETKDSQNSKGHLRKETSSLFLRFDEVGESKNIDDMKNYEAEDNEFGNFQIFFELDHGLSRDIAGKKVPAFVTYEITVKKENYKGESPVFCKVRGTIQGLLTGSQHYRWCHAITYGESGKEKSETVVVVKTRIIDTDADSAFGRLRIRGAGYNVFRENSENRTEGLVTEG